MLFRSEKAEMDKLYDKAFKVGFWCNALLFIVVNIISCVATVSEYESKSQLADAGGYSFGFPFEIYRNYIGYPYSEIGFTPFGVIKNTFFIAGCGFVIGLLSKFIWAKISSRRSSLK